jgi:hypothetical protein
VKAETKEAGTKTSHPLDNNQGTTTVSVHNQPSTQEDDILVARFSAAVQRWM